MAAEWWELAIPATAALTAGWLGAWWQGRSALRLLHEQARETERVRRANDQAEFAKREEALRHEKLMRLYDEKRAACPICQLD